MAVKDNTGGGRQAGGRCFLSLAECCLLFPPHHHHHPRLAGSLFPARLLLVCLMRGEETVIEGGRSRGRPQVFAAPPEFPAV